LNEVDLWNRIDDRVAAWRIAVERVTETENSVLSFGWCDNRPVVLKVIKTPGDEWRSGQILDAFGGAGVVRVYEYVDGALLLERLTPGQPLVSLALHGSDDESSSVLADVIGKMSPACEVDTAPTASDVGRGFDRYVASGDAQVPSDLVTTAHRVYAELCRSQRRVRLLHGDLHHYNVLLDAERGWLAIDPKGVVGEVEYEVGAALRNPIERPALFTDPSIIRKRVDCFTRTLGLDANRVLSWAFSQAVLSAIWAVEDGFRVEMDGWIAFASTVRLMLEGDGVPRVQSVP
jgi:streptomycin 6-kinase